MPGSCFHCDYIITDTDVYTTTRKKTTVLYRRKSKMFGTFILPNNYFQVIKVKLPALSFQDKLQRVTLKVTSEQTNLCVSSDSPVPGSSCERRALLGPPHRCCSAQEAQRNIRQGRHRASVGKPRTAKLIPTVNTPHKARVNLSRKTEEVTVCNTPHKGQSKS